MDNEQVRVYQSMGIRPGSRVLYFHEEYKVVRIGESGGMTLEDSDGNMTEGVYWWEVKKIPDKTPTAHDALGELHQAAVDVYNHYMPGRQHRLSQRETEIWSRLSAALDEAKYLLERVYPDEYEPD
jgi:hypothetical protein